MKLSYHGHSLGRKVQWKVRSLFNSTYDSDNESEDEPKDEYAQFAADLAADLRRRKVALPSRAQRKMHEESKQRRKRIRGWNQDPDSYVPSSSTVSPAPSNQTAVTDSTLVDYSYSKTTCQELYCPLPGVEYSPTWKITDLIVQSKQEPSTPKTHNKAGRRNQSTSPQHSNYMPLGQYIAREIAPEDWPLSNNRALSSSSNLSLSHVSEQYGTDPDAPSDENDAIPCRTWSFTSGLADVLDLHPLAIRSTSKSRTVDKSKANLSLQNSLVQPYRGVGEAREAETLVKDKGSGGFRRFRGFHRNGKAGNVRHGYVESTVRPSEELEQLNIWNSVLIQPEGPFPLAELQGDSLGAEASVGPTIRPRDELEQLNTWKPAPKQPEVLPCLAELQGTNSYAAVTNVKDAFPSFWSDKSPSAEHKSGDADLGVANKRPQQYDPNFVPLGMPPLKFVPSAGVPYRIHQTALKPRLAPLAVPSLGAYKKQLESKASKNVDPIAIAKNDVCYAVTKLPNLETDLSNGPMSKITPTVIQAASGAGSERSSKSSKSRDSSGKSTEGSGGSTPSSNHGNKRKKTNGRDGDQEGLSDSDSHQRRKKKDMPNQHGNPQTRRLKCPYYQRRPEECRLASCRGQGFTEMAKLK